MVWFIGAIAINYLVLKSSKTLFEVLYKGFLLGFMGYVFFNFTNYFLIKKYTLDVVYMDTIYGTLIFGFLAYMYAKYIMKLK